VVVVAAEEEELSWLREPPVAAAEPGVEGAPAAPGV